MLATLALAAIIVTNPAACPASAPWAQPAGEVGYVCVASDFGEQVPDPSHAKKPPVVVHHKPVVHHKYVPVHHKHGLVRAHKAR